MISLVLLMMLTGCVSVGMKADQGMIVRTVGETNMFRPSLSVMEVSKCVQDRSGRYEEVQTEDGTVGCYGQFMPVAVVQGTQAGAMTGIGGAMVQGGAIVGGAYLLADGIRDKKADQTSVNQQGGGANSASNSSPISVNSVDNRNAASAVAQQTQAQSQAAHSSSRVINNLPMMGGMD